MKIARQDQEDSLLTIFLLRQHAGPCDALPARIGFLVAFRRRSSSRPLPGTPRLQLAPDLNPAQQLDRTLSEIAERFGPTRSEWVIGIRRKSALIELSPILASP